MWCHDVLWAFWRCKKTHQRPVLTPPTFFDGCYLRRIGRRRAWRWMVEVVALLLTMRFSSEIFMIYAGKYMSLESFKLKQKKKWEPIRPGVRYLWEVIVLVFFTLFAFLHMLVSRPDSVRFLWSLAQTTPFFALSTLRYSEEPTSCQKREIWGWAKKWKKWKNTKR